jgi:Ca2+-binding EF-hand superfamily protein
MVQALDANGDGEISADELANAVSALKTLDRDGDGKLAGEEIRPAFGRFGGRAVRASA